jgi:energy-coupling factor transporter ATP-binding protein EcfA2
VIDVRGLGHVYAAGSPWAHRALEDVNLGFGTGEQVVIVGANGSGKSTLAWALAGVLDPTEGTVQLNGLPIDLTKSETAISFQHARLQLFRSTVASDVRYGAKVDDQVVDDALTFVGLDPRTFRDRKVDELSGGEQRRTALAGALIRRPRLLVLDEPLAGLDAPGRRNLVAMLSRLREMGGMTVVSVTHDLGFAHLLATRAVVLHRGRVAADGPVADVVASYASKILERD